MLCNSVIKMIYEHLEVTHMLSHIFSMFMILFFLFQKVYFEWFTEPEFNVEDGI